MFISMTLTFALLGGFTDAETEIQQRCFIENLIYEAADQGDKGMQLVAEVTLNRIDTGYRGATTFCHVVHDTAQFSWTATPKDQRRVYTKEEYLAAARVAFSVLYEKTPRILPKRTFHYLNVAKSGDLIWYDQKRVVYQYRDHQFLVLN